MRFGNIPVLVEDLIEISFREPVRLGINMLIHLEPQRLRLLRLQRRNQTKISLQRLFAAFGEMAKNARVVSRRPVTITMPFNRSLMIA